MGTHARLEKRRNVNMYNNMLYHLATGLKIAFKIFEVSSNSVQCSERWIHDVYCFMISSSVNKWTATFLVIVFLCSELFFFDFYAKCLLCINRFNRYQCQTMMMVMNKFLDLPLISILIYWHHLLIRQQNKKRKNLLSIVVNNEKKKFEIFRFIVIDFRQL